MSAEDLDTSGSSPGDAEPNQDEIFPTLTPEQIARIAVSARERRLADGEILWDQGDANRPLFVIVEGEVAILSDTNHLVTVHRAGGFSGDVDLLSGRPVVVRGQARGATRVLELAAERLRLHGGQASATGRPPPCASSWSRTTTTTATAWFSFCNSSATKPRV